MRSVYVGIDPSMNSTGICVLYYEDDTKIKEHFYIVKPNKLTKKENDAQDKLLFFDYVIYEKKDLTEYKSNNHLHEYYKTVNMVELVDYIYNIITDPSVKLPYIEVHIVMEGISYGSSVKTKSIFDLAGLNYMIRQRILHNPDLNFIIATPSEIKKYATGNGNCNKEAMIALFQATHEDFKLPKIDDIADAYFMAKYARYITKYK